MSVVARQAPASPSSPISRRGSWIDLPSLSPASSRRASVVASPTTASSESITTVAGDSLVNILASLAEATKARSVLGMKRKFETEPALSPFRKASAADIHLPSDPSRRASIINLATAAAAAVLQSQAVQDRRSSTVPDPDAKRQRVQQLDLLYEQARNATTSTHADVSTPSQPESAPSETPVPNLASSLGITPKNSPRIGVSSSPSTPKKQQPLTSATPDNAEIQATSPLAALPRLASLANSTSSSPVLGPSSRTPQPVADNEALLQDVQEANDQFNRFYQFESRWAKKALELEQRRASVRIDPLSDPAPQLKAASPARARSGVSSPLLHPTSVAVQANSPSFTAVRGSSVGGLATVLSDFAELIEHRQRSCSSLEALAKQARELPKRLSQPNPQFRSTFDEFSWSRRSQTPSAASTVSQSNGARQVITEEARDTESSETLQSNSATLRSKPEADNVSGALSSAPTAQEADPQPATPRSSMSIASML